MEILENELKNKNIIIENLLIEINELKEKEKNFNKFKEDFLKIKDNKKKEINKTETRKRNITEFKKNNNNKNSLKKNLKEEVSNDKIDEGNEEDNEDEEIDDFKLTNTPNNDLNIWIKLINIFKKLNLSNSKKIKIESQLKDYFQKNGKKFDIFKDLNSNLNLFLKYIIKKNENNNHYEIIDKLEKENDDFKTKINNFKQLKNELINKNNTQHNEYNLILKEKNKLVENIKNIEIEKEILLQKIIDKDNIIANLDRKKNKSFSIEIDKFKNEHSLNINEKNFTIKNLKNDILKLNEKISQYQNEINYLNKNIDKYKNLWKNSIHELSTKESYVNKLNFKYEENINEIKNIYDNKLKYMENKYSCINEDYKNDNFELSKFLGDNNNDSINIQNEIEEFNNFDENVDENFNNCENSLNKEEESLIIYNNNNDNKELQNDFNILKIKFEKWEKDYNSLKENNENLFNKFIDLNKKFLTQKNEFISKSNNLLKKLKEKDFLVEEYKKNF